MRPFAKVILSTAALLLFAYLIPLAVSPAAAQNTHLCSQQLGGLAGLPDVDGTVRGDVGWTNAAEYNFGNGNGTGYRGKFLMGHTSDSLYIGLHEGLDQNSDRVISIGFDPPNATAKIAHIYLPPSPAENLRAYTGSGWGSSTTLTDWTIEDAGGQNQWSAEIRIPLGSGFNGVQPDGVDLPTNSSTTFGLYVNMFTAPYILSNGSQGVVQSPWPTSAEITSGDIESNAPSPSAWGTASLGSRSNCTGVKLEVADVGTKNPNTSDNEMTLGSAQQVNQLCSGQTSQTLFGPADNTFFARPENTSGSSANGVEVRFRLADWGVNPGVFNEISGPGVSPNNPVPANSIPGNGTHEFTMDWTLTEEQVCQYNNNRHQCIQVGMRSNAPGVRILNKAVTRNMDFTTASTFERQATINLRGIEVPEDQNAHNAILDVTKQVQKFREGDEEYVAVQKADLTNPEERSVIERREELPTVDEEQEVDPPLSTSLLGFDRIDKRQYPDGLAEAMSWVGRVYVERPSKIQIRDSEYENLEYAGSFGTVTGHASDNVEKWSQSVSGDVQPAGEAGSGRYQINFVENEPVADVGVRIEAEEGSTGGGGDPGNGNGDGSSGGDNGCPSTGSSSTSGMLLFVGLSFIGLVVYRRRRQ